MRNNFKEKSVKLMHPCILNVEMFEKATSMKDFRKKHGFLTFSLLVSLKIVNIE